MLEWLIGATEGGKAATVSKEHLVGYIKDELEDLDTAVADLNLPSSAMRGGAGSLVAAAAALSSSPATPTSLGVAAAQGGPALWVNSNRIVAGGDGRYIEGGVPLSHLQNHRVVSAGGSPFKRLAAAAAAPPSSGSPSAARMETQLSMQE